LRNLYIVTGTSGSGKTSMVAPLKSKIDQEWDVWDIDEIVWNLPSFGHPDAPVLTSWKPGDDTKVFNDCKNICLVDAAKGTTPIILCGTFLPHEVYDESKNLFGLIRWVGLYASPDTIRERLKARKWSEDQIEVYADTYKWFSNVPNDVDGPMPLIDTTGRSSESVAAEIYQHILK